MSQTNCLDTLIQEVDAATQATRPGTKRVVVDVNRRSAVSLDWFRSAASLKYFLVSTVDVAYCQATVIYIDHADQGKAVGLRVELAASCTEGREDKVAESLCGDPNPTAEFNTKIREWVREFLNQQGLAFLEAFSTARIDLGSHLAERALAELGLDLTAEVSLPGGENVISNFNFGPVDLLVDLLDGPPQQISLKAELTTSHLVDAIAYRGNTRVDDLVEQITRRYFRENVRLSQLYGQSDEVVSGLKDHLNEGLRTMGQRVKGLDLECEKKVPQGSGHLEEQIEYGLPGHSEPLIVRSVAQVIVQDHANYVSSGTLNLAEWFRENLEQSLAEVLPGRTYESIMRELGPLTRDIRNKMNFKAAEIGCSIQQQLTITSAKIEGWLKGFEIVTEDSFETTLEGIRARLKVTVNALLRQAGEVNDYLGRGIDLRDLLERKINDEVRQTVMTIHPERLYVRRAFLESGDEQEPVKSLLRRKLQEMLTRDFHAEVISVVIESTDREFIKWIDDLRRENISFEAEVSSHRPHNKGPFIYFFDCQIVDISDKGWETVSAAAFDIGKLKAELTNALKSALETHGDLDLAYSNDEAAEKVKKKIVVLIKEYASREFGLSVKVSNVRRKATEIERRMREARMANELVRVDMLRKLEHHVLQLIANGGKDEEIDQWQKRIAVLRSYKSPSFGSSEDEAWQATEAESGGQAGASGVVDDRVVSTVGSVSGRQLLDN
jgi:hypothetical protein